MGTPSNDPPWWFRPAVFGTIILAVAALWALVARDGGSAAEPIEISGSSFLIPPAHHTAKGDEGALFVRIKPPGKLYEIVHDARSEGRHDRAGLPVIFSVNDHGEHDVRYVRIRRALVACRRASAPAAGCGTWIDYRGTVWSVLFPEAHIEDAERIARDASAVLGGYDARSRRLVI